MENPGEYDLGARAITTALTDVVITEGVSAANVAQAFVDRLDGMTALTLVAAFVYGSGGTSCVVVVQTSLDGVTWIDVARFDFAQANATKWANLSGLTPKGITALAALAAEGVTDGVLGTRLRAKVTSTGTYAGNTSISIKAVAR